MKDAGGRPREDFDWDIVEALVARRSTERYVAEYLLKKEGIPPGMITRNMLMAKVRLIQRRIKERFGMTYMEYRDVKQDSWREELVELQRKAARDGNITMQIWLGKQDLGQLDRQQLDITKIDDDTFMREAERRLHGAKGKEHPPRLDYKEEEQNVRRKDILI